MICPQCQQNNLPEVATCTNCRFNLQHPSFAPLSFPSRNEFVTIAVMIFILVIIILIASPELLMRGGCGGGRETGAIGSLRSIYDSQLHYQSMKGKFGTLRELTDAGFIADKSYATGKPVSGYIYTDSDVSTDTFCIHADRATNSNHANRDFNISEDGIIHAIESKTKGTVARGAGTAINGIESGEQTDEAPKK